MSDKELQDKADELLDKYKYAMDEGVEDSYRDEIIALVREHDAKSSFAVTGIGKEIRADERQRCVERACAVGDKLASEAIDTLELGVIRRYQKALRDEFTDK